MVSKVSAAYMALELLMALLAVAGNVLVCWAVCLNSNLQSITNFFVVSLAVADIAVGLLAIPFAITISTGFCSHFHGCLFIACFVLVLTQSSIFSLFAIAVDRYIAIKIPLRYNSLVTSQRAKSIIAVCWILSVVIGLTPMLGWNKRTTPSSNSSCPAGMTECLFEEVVTMGYMVYFNFFGCVLAPLLAMLVIYARIFMAARRQLRQMELKLSHGHYSQRQGHNSQGHHSHGHHSQGHHSQGHHSQSHGFQGNQSQGHHSQRHLSQGHHSQGHDSQGKQSQGPESQGHHSQRHHSQGHNFQVHHSQRHHSQGHHSQRHHSQRPHSHEGSSTRSTLQREVHAAKSLAIIVGLFALCWLPLHIINCFTLFCPKCARPPVWIMYLAIIFSHANSVVNPFIYAYRIRDFRLTFRRIIRQHFLKQRDRFGSGSTTTNTGNMTTSTGISIVDSTFSSAPNGNAFTPSPSPCNDHKVLKQIHSNSSRQWRPRTEISDLDQSSNALPSLDHVLTTQSKLCSLGCSDDELSSSKNSSEIMMVMDCSIITNVNFRSLPTRTNHSVELAEVS